MWKVYSSSASVLLSFLEQILVLEGKSLGG